MSEKGSITIKQVGSMAGDAHVTFSIDRERKAIAVEMTTARGKSFVSSRALEMLALQTLPEHGVVAFNSDQPKSFTDWRLFVDVAGQWFEAQIIKQNGINGGAVVVELYPAESKATEI